MARPPVARSLFVVLAAIAAWSSCEGSLGDGPPGCDAGGTCANAGGGNVAGGNVAGGNVAGGNVAGGNVAGGNVAGGNVAGGNVAGGRVDAGVTRRPSVFVMDYSADAGLVGGWTARKADNADHTLSRLENLGPSGQNVYRLVMDHNGPAGGDNYWGHARTFTGAPFVYGGRAYFRWGFRWLPNTNCRAYEQGGTGLLSGVWRNKVLIVNDGSSPLSSRFIMNFDCERSPLQYRWRLAKGGGVDLANTPYFPVTTAWVDVQVELQYSSAAAAADGAYRVWINSNVRAAPTAEMTAILLHADVDPGSVQFGAYFNNGVFSDGSIGWEHTDFQIDDQFDPAWH